MNNDARQEKWDNIDVVTKRQTLEIKETTCHRIVVIEAIFS